MVCGAGRVGIGQDGREHGFQISQRADYFEVEVGLETTLKRPIINTRDEPHADPEKYRRLHVIIGDANLAEISTYLKVGTTSLVLAMIEDRFITARPRGRSSRSARCARSRTTRPCTHLLTLRDGRRLTAVQLQMEYLDLARKYVEDRLRRRRRRRRPGTCWTAGSRCSTRLERTRCCAREELDWVAKLELLEPYRDRDGLDWDDAKLHLIDLQYADMRPEKGLYHRLRPARPDRAAGHRRRGRAGHARARRRTPAPTSAAAAWSSTPTRSPPPPGTR